MLNKLQKLGPAPKGTCKVHKYIRFSAKNKTYRTDIYYCVNCPNYVSVDMIVGHESICWKCGGEFTIGIKKPNMKPNCGCKGKAKPKTEEVKGLEWMEGDNNKEEENPMEVLMDLVEKRTG